MYTNSWRWKKYCTSSVEVAAQSWPIFGTVVPYHIESYREMKFKKNARTLRNLTLNRCFSTNTQLYLTYDSSYNAEFQSASNAGGITFPLWSGQKISWETCVPKSPYISLYIPKKSLLLDEALVIRVASCSACCSMIVLRKNVFLYLLF
jgi:hypothetical protein